MKSFKRAVYKVGLQEEMKQISCIQSLNVDGKEGIYEVEITIGTETGDTGLRYESFSIPDRFQLFFDGQLVADSKYVGNQLSIYQSQLLAMENKVLPIFEYDGTQFVDTGRTETISPQLSDMANGTASEPTAGKGQLKFNKNKAEVTVMKLRVIGALGQTLWNAAPICPNKFTTVPSSGSTTNPTIKSYDLILHRNITSFACEELEQGTLSMLYSTENLIIGAKLYTDRQLLKLAPSGFAYLGRTIYELDQGVIRDIYPCFKMALE